MKKLEPSAQSRNERDIRRIMIAGTAIGFGFMAASLEALRPSPNGFTFQITARTFLAFALGVAAVIPFWKVAFGLVTGNRTRSRHVWAALLLLVVGVAAFLYPTRFVPSEKRHDLYIGLVLAVFALSVLASILVMIGRFLEADAANTQEATATETPKFPKKHEGQT